ncbi:MAG: cytochrome c [Rhodospirillaceae bacterium]|mgnify:FL=1|jgi:cytochrome c556|nr:cytochrome c [Rhodospirillaceae bacterium]MBT5566135.1 cytochrome c [Rhodospirillaceae bacterium]MBT6090608.1 cytochrome c [Rhodospirillaceae bacterium]MBT6960254.1 cytochrome c [Rhodospirillaceae bacterium]
MTFRYLAAALAAVIFTFGLSAAQAADKDVIDYRQNLMKSLGAHAGGLGAIAQNKVPYGDNLAYHADAIAAAAEAAQLAFEQNLPGGTSAANIWENWEDFQGRFASLADAARDVAAAARSGGMAEAGPKMGSLFICKSCHDTYRTE